ncbi:MULTISPECIES: hypothetical protein [unclassified Rhizobium]|uniref:hypothetical protein n=1 Tax=unclassified Rhizobium TaxID=2613769 RepID=UPI0007010BCB|nr:MULTISPECIES: hypothetical protein [unclassified Rhizobium]KQV35673.1 hypothetical protein ASC86_10725 [Rhizobium sp. Root1212]KRD25780.1 hypothetical protein ASE37_10720 [Rhizobium sp. Root268]
MRIVSAMLLAVLTTILGLHPADAADKTLKAADLKELLGNGKTLALGGKGMGYTGTLNLSADGKGEGSAKTDGGDVITISGTWHIQGDKFCRTWAGLDKGKEVCETWRLTSPNHVDVFQGKKKIGANSW